MSPRVRVEESRKVMLFLMFALLLEQKPYNLLMKLVMVLFMLLIFLLKESY